MLQALRNDAMVATIFTLGFVFALNACTVLRLEAPDGVVRIEHHLGLLNVSFADPGQGHIAEVQSLGIVRTPLGLTAGYAHHKWVLLPLEQCQVVFWVEDGTQLAAAQSLLESSHLLCTPPSGERGGQQ